MQQRLRNKGVMGRNSIAHEPYILYYSADLCMIDLPGAGGEPSESPTRKSKACSSADQFIRNKQQPHHMAESGRVKIHILLEYDDDGDDLIKMHIDQHNIPQHF